MRLARRNVSRGDTIIEVMFSIVVFCLVSLLAINLMNSGISTAQASLEITMARNEIDAQAEAIRFIQNSYLAERNFNGDQQQYYRLWDKMTTGSYDDREFAIPASELDPFNTNDCEEAYHGEHNRNLRTDITGRAFIINTRFIEPFSGSEYRAYDEFSMHTYTELLNEIFIPVRTGKLVPAPLYPRVIFERSAASGDSDIELSETGLYRKVAQAEGIWVVAVKSDALYRGKPEFFDFHIRTCWYAPGRSHPTTIGTIIRLYNPDVVEIQNEVW